MNLRTRGNIIWATAWFAVIMALSMTEWYRGILYVFAAAYAFHVTFRLDRLYIQNPEHVNNQED